MAATYPLRQQIEQIAIRSRLAEHLAFTYWLMKARFGVESDERIKKSICDASGDCGVDAVHIDDKAQHVYVVQSKYTAKFGGKIGPQDVRQLAELSRLLFDAKRRRDRLRKANATAKELIESVVERANRGYRVQFLLATTKKSTRKQFERELAKLHVEHRDFAICALDECERLRLDELSGYSPPTPPVRLRYNRAAGKLLVSEAAMPARSWSYATDAAAIADLVRNAGSDQIFRKNVREFLGGKVSKRVIATLKEQPNCFWFYNSGITILAESIRDEDDNQALVLENAHIVNGCQTAQSIVKCGLPEKELKGVLVPVRIICPRSSGASAAFVSELIVAQNTANAIKSRDLKSNDPRQLELQRSFRERGYFLEIKRGVTFTKLSKLKRSSYRFKPISNDAIGLAQFAAESPVEAKKHKAELFDGNFYEVAFPDGANVFNYLGANYLLIAIGASYKSHNKKKRFGDFTARTFESHARLFALHLLWRELRRRSRRGWSNQLRSIVESAEAEYTTHGGVGFEAAVKPVADVVFDVLHVAYKAGAARIGSTESEDEVVEATPANFFISDKAGKFVDRALAGHQGRLDKKVNAMLNWLVLYRAKRSDEAPGPLSSAR
jgi:hypothetical protein